MCVIIRILVFVGLFRDRWDWAGYISMGHGKILRPLFFILFT